MHPILNVENRGKCEFNVEMMIYYRIANFLFGFFELGKVYLGPVELLFSFCFSSLNGVDRDAKFGINLLKWLIEPISDLMSFIHRGSFNFLIASDL